LGQAEMQNPIDYLKPEIEPALIGLELGIFIVGLYFLVKGPGESDDGKVVNGALVRLAGLCIVLPLPVIVVFAQFTLADSESLPTRSLGLMESVSGIALIIMGLLVGMVVLRYAYHSS